ITSGTITFTPGDGPAAVTIGGIPVTGPATIAGAFGTLTIDSYDPAGSISYHYTLTEDTSGDDTHDDFAVVVTDVDGEKATGTLVINIVDDVPTARNDTDSVAAGHTEGGNVITGANTTSGAAGADTPGADGATVTGVAAGNVPAGVAGGVGGSGIAGSLGTLILNADGSYSYHANPNVSGTDVFTYTLTDGDGDKS